MPRGRLNRDFKPLGVNTVSFPWAPLSDPVSIRLLWHWMHCIYLSLTPRLSHSTLRCKPKRAVSWWRPRKYNVHVVALAFHQNIIESLALVRAGPRQNVPGQPGLGVEPIACGHVLGTDWDASNEAGALPDLHLAAKAQAPGGRVRQSENKRPGIAIPNHQGERETLRCAVGQLFELRNRYAVDPVIGPQCEQTYDCQRCRN
jgi:hypothetical protein